MKFLQNEMVTAEVLPKDKDIAVGCLASQLRTKQHTEGNTIPTAVKELGNQTFNSWLCSQIPKLRSYPAGDVILLSNIPKSLKNGSENGRK